MPRPELRRLAWLVPALLFVALAWPGAGRRGIIAEEVQPYLARHPFVLEEVRGVVKPMPPDEPGAAARPRWVSTSQWPQLAYDGASRQWPLLIRGHQTALGAVPGIVAGPLLGGGIAGVRRATVLMGLGVVLLTWVLAARLGRGDATLAAVLLAGSFGMIVIARTGYGFEVASRLAMLGALVVAVPRGPPSWRRALAVGALAGVAIISRATVALALVPALAVLWRRAPLGKSAAAGATLLAVPAAVLAFAVWVTPPRPDSLPLDAFPWGELPARLAGIPRQALLVLAWLGDAGSIWRPLALGHMSLGALGASAAIAAVPTGAALWRLARGGAGPGEKLFLAALGTTVVGGALLYRDPNQFQLALALEPFLAIAVAEQLAAVPARRVRGALVVAVLAWRALTAAWGLSLDARAANPMLSGACQRGAVARLEALGVPGERIVATTYNMAGVVEAWSDERLRPVHAWHLLRTSPGNDARLEQVFAGLLATRRPELVLLSEGTNLFESGGMDPPGIARALRAVAARQGVTLVDEGHFPTESGAPGWAVVRLVYPRE